MIRLKLLLVMLLAVMGILVPGLASAQVLEEPCSIVQGDICKRDNDPGENASGLLGQDGVVGQVVQLLGIAAGIIGVIMIIIAGLRFVSSGGDTAKVSSARNAIIYAVVGLVIAATAQFIIIFVINKI